MRTVHGAAWVLLAGWLLAAAPAGGGQGEVEIDGLLTAWHRAAAVADEAAYFGFLAEDAVFLGTDAGERWTKADFVRQYLPYFQRESAWVFVAKQRWISLSGDGRVAWFDELLDSASYWTCRGSGVLTRDEDGRWRLRQYNLAFTIPNGLTREVKTLIERGAPSPTAGARP